MELLLKAAVLGVVEGITEFLPISSTGHLILVNRFIHFTGTFADMFDVVIQLGAILSVMVYFRKRLYPFGPAATTVEKAEIWGNWKKAVVAVLPALVIGAAFGGIIKEKLFNPLTVALALFVGGLLLMAAERRSKTGTIQSVAELGYRTAIAIGLIQCLSMVPGTSRAAATIIGAMLLGLTRSAAVEFSFFLSIPTMIAASGYALLKHGALLSGHEWLALSVGFAVSFVVALGVIAFLMNYIRQHDFRPFAWYRIALGLVIGVLLYSGALSMD